MNIKLWNGQTYELIITLEGHTERIASLLFYKD
jgi:hypothetical protein